MEQPIISVQNATVRFNLAQERTDNLKEYVIKLLKKQLLFQEFFALKNINFEVKKGEAWGLIGVNGSGKSTLLKLISGIIDPYDGEVEVNGHIAPLIELSAGMDGDMTARENIYLNGAFLGYSEQLIEEKFDEIVNFADIASFIDVPVKNFSSGMMARLGFSVATIVKPEILIVDEALSVGDMAFQKKCMKRMENLLTDGTTLLFVSHALPTVRDICKKVIWLDHGEVVMNGEAKEVCDAYEKVQNG